MDWGIVTVFAIAGVGVGRLGSLVLRRTVICGSHYWCEVGVGVLWALVACRWLLGGWPIWWLGIPLATTAVGVPLVVADLRVRRLPNVLTLPAYVLVGAMLALAACGSAHGGALATGAVTGAVVFASAHTIVHVARPASLGAGDAKLAGSVGAVLGAVGWSGLIVGAILAALVTIVLAGVGRLHGRVASPPKRRLWQNGIPHGPGMVVATWLLSVFPGSGVGMAG